MPKINAVTGLNLLAAFFGFTLRAAGFFLGLVRFANNVGSPKNNLPAEAFLTRLALTLAFFTRDFFKAGLAGFLAAGFATSLLFLDNLAVGYRRSATKRPRFLPEPLIMSPYPVPACFSQSTTPVAECRGGVLNRIRCVAA
ncbi:MAG: hypothetical protein L3J30_11610 [Marinosulfonomonas sp.]|nr:hypothetical protein [Marinosulfonomonas sp.]